MQEVHRFQNVIVRLTQEEAGLKEEEAQIHSRYQQRRDDGRKWIYVNVRRTSVLKSKFLNLIHRWPGESQRLHVSRRSSGVFQHTLSPWRSTTSESVTPSLRCPTRTWSSCLWTSIDASAVFNQAPSSHTDSNSARISVTASCASRRATINYCAPLAKSTTRFSQPPEPILNVNQH